MWSPSKTVEGLGGGGLAAVGIGTPLWWITPFTPLQSALMSALIVVCGALGGLALSAVKRSLGANDWAHIIDGHGGILDRMPSVTFAAPLFFPVTPSFFSYFIPPAASLLCLFLFYTPRPPSALPFLFPFLSPPPPFSSLLF